MARLNFQLEVVPLEVNNCNKTRVREEKSIFSNFLNRVFQNIIFVSVVCADAILSVMTSMDFSSVLYTSDVK